MEIKLKNEICAIEDEIARLERELKLKKCELAEMEYGIKIGEIVISEGKKYKIMGYDTYWPKGYLIKKDGTCGTQPHNLYHIKRKSE